MYLCMCLCTVFIYTCMFSPPSLSLPSLPLPLLPSLPLPPSPSLSSLPSLSLPLLPLPSLPLPQSILSLHNLSDGAHVSNFPLEMGSITGYSGKRHQTEIFYRLVSFLSPGVIFRCDLTKTPIEPEVVNTLYV